jgi:hypothetical protein
VVIESTADTPVPAIAIVFCSVAIEGVADPLRLVS